MSVYFNRELPFPKYNVSDPDAVVHREVGWQKNSSMLAVASKNSRTSSDGSVNFFQEDGDLLSSSSINRSVMANCLEWHPEKKIIAIGWGSGEITTANLSDSNNQVVYEQSSIHRVGIAVLRWNQTGTRLITGDQSGTLVVWQVEYLGQLYPTPLLTHRFNCSPTHLLMLHPSIMAARGSVTKRSTGTGKGSIFDNYGWQKKSGAGKALTDPISCFISTQEGGLYFMDNTGDCVERCRLNNTIQFLILHPDVRVLSVVTANTHLSQFSINMDGQTTVTTTQVKLSGGQSKIVCIIAVARNILASCANEGMIRFWDFENNDNFSLALQKYSEAPVAEVVTSISYNRNKELLAAGTDCGNVLLWKWNESRRPREADAAANTMDGSSVWEFIASTPVMAPAATLTWNMGKKLLAVNSNTSVQILSEHIVSTRYNQKVTVVQISPGEAQVECHDTKLIFTFRANILIKGILNTKNHVAVWGSKKVEVYSIIRKKFIMHLEGSFHASTKSLGLSDSSVYSIDNKQINIRSFQGTVKQVIPLEEHEGEPHCLSVTGQYLVCGTTKGHVKLWDTGRRECKLLGMTDLKVPIADLSEIVSVSSNSNGSRVSIIVKLLDDPDYKELVLWFVDQDSIAVFDANSVLNLHSEEEVGHNDMLHIQLPELADNSLKEQRRLLVDLVGRVPELHYWDCDEPQLLAVEWSQSTTTLTTLDRRKVDSTFSIRSDKISVAENLVSAFFITHEKTFLISELLRQDPALTKLLGITLPHVYFLKKGLVGMLSKPREDNPETASGQAPKKTKSSTVSKVTLKDFVGLENSSVQVLRAMVEFSYHSAMGNMDGAYKAIKLIKNQAVWESMARMCVKTQRLDVAVVCLGNMGNARAAGTVRRCYDIPEVDARVAYLAIELGMLGEAEYLFRRSKRYDLLNEFYQYSGEWAKAVEIAETKDRLHLKTTYYAFGRHAEDTGDIPAAIKSYEKSETHQFEVPRMLLETADLEDYVLKSQDKGIRKWWAEYLESMGEWEQAMQCYEAAQDYYSLVRILCFNGQLDKAAEITEETECKAAAYHLARRLNVENEDPRRTIHFFTQAQCYTPAIQIAKEHHLDGELVHLSLLSTQEDMLDSARYYEENTGDIDKAILLYHKAGEISRAVDMCFQHRHFEMVDQVADDLTEATDPELTQKVADYFMEKGLVDKAMEILLKTKKMDDALKLCTMYNVPLTDELVEKMSVPKRDDETPEETQHRVMVLEKLAECCLSMGAYHLAAKKFTQAGSTVKAMKALLKSGDTEKIIFFAGVSRQKDIYILAANYLQTLDWRSDHEILKHIITFYTKGKALEPLAGFYDACAQAEIDECQDYPKAIGALEQAIKVLKKLKGSNPTIVEAKLSFVQDRIDTITRFVEAQRMYAIDHVKSIDLCEGLLEDPNLDVAVRVGDVYAFIIHHHTSCDNHDKAYSLMTDLQQRVPNAVLSDYVHEQVLDVVHTALGIPLRHKAQGQQENSRRQSVASGEVEEEQLDESEEDYS